MVIVTSVVTVVMLVATIGSALALDCHGRLVVIGASPWEVKERCGEPTAIEDVMKHLPQRAYDPISHTTVYILVWEEQDGQKHSKHELVADRLQTTTGGRKSSGREPGSADEPGGRFARDGPVEGVRARGGVPCAGGGERTWCTTRHGRVAPHDSEFRPRASLVIPVAIAVVIVQVVIGALMQATDPRRPREECRSMAMMARTPHSGAPAGKGAARERP